MRRTTIILLGGFLAVFAAGASTALLVESSTRPPERGSWLSRELDLTPEQRTQIRAIWTEAMRTSRQQYMAQRQALSEETRSRVKALLGPDGQAAYDQLMQEHEEQLQELRRARREAYRAAGEQTSAVLNEEQRRKYDAWVEKRMSAGQNGDRDRQGEEQGAVPSTNGQAETDQGAQQP